MTEPTGKTHTNCWCATDVIRCSAPDCPRRPRYFAQQEQQRVDRERLAALLDWAKDVEMTPEEIAAQRASWGRQDKD